MFQGIRAWIQRLLERQKIHIIIEMVPRNSERGAEYYPFDLESSTWWAPEVGEIVDAVRRSKGVGESQDMDRLRLFVAGRPARLWTQLDLSARRGEQRTILIRAENFPL